MLVSMEVVSFWLITAYSTVGNYPYLSLAIEKQVVDEVMVKAGRILVVVIIAFYVVTIIACQSIACTNPYIAILILD